MEMRSQDSDIIALFNQGLDEHNAGDLNAAEQIYKETLALQPDHCEANHNIGIVLVAKNELDKALEFFKLALNSSPNVSLFWASYIDTLAKLERIIEAKALIKASKKSGLFCEKMKVISQRLDVEHPEPNVKDFHAIDEFMAQQKFDAAIEACFELMGTYPESAILNIHLGKCYFELGQIEFGISSYEKAIKYQPQWEVGFAMLGTLYSSQGDSVQAIENLQQALKLNPLDAISHFNMGKALQATGSVQAAIVSLKRAIKIKPDYAEAYYNIGVVFQEKGDLEAATDSYKQTLKIKPDYADAYSNMGTALHHRGELDAAIDSYKQALKIKPDHADAYYNMGVALQAKGELSAAIASYKQAIQIKPDYAAAHYNLGLSLDDKGDLDAAIESYKQALKIKPDHAKAQHILAAATGKQTVSAPNKYIEELFDGYAAKFEHSLVDKLKYQIPKLIAELVSKHQSSAVLGSMLDLGCGTGLAGVELKGLCQNIEGIDLSKKMLTEASQKNVYDKLNHTGIIEYLSEAPLDFDLFVSTDVFVYVGDLYEVFRLIKSRNKRKGWLVFSTEHTQKDGFFLEKSGRYSHSKGYIESLCVEFDYKSLHFSKTDLRKDKGEFVAGGLYLLEF